MNSDCDDFDKEIFDADRSHKSFRKIILKTNLIEREIRHSCY